MPLKFGNNIVHAPSDNAWTVWWWNAFAELARAIIEDVESRKMALDGCDWLTQEQKEKINITPEYIEIDGIKLRLYDESETMDFEWFKDVAPTKEQWNQIVDFLWNPDNTWSRQWWGEERISFFENVLKMQKRVYASSTECRDGYTLETHMSGPKYQILEFERDFLSTIWMKNQKTHSHVRTLAI